MDVKAAWRMLRRETCACGAAPRKCDARCVCAAVQIRACPAEAGSTVRCRGCTAPAVLGCGSTRASGASVRFNRGAPLDPNQAAGFGKRRVRAQQARATGRPRVAPGRDSRAAHQYRSGWGWQPALRIHCLCGARFWRRSTVRQGQTSQRPSLPAAVRPAATA